MVTVFVPQTPGYLGPDPAERRGAVHHFVTRLGYEAKAEI
jgi:hypothetical protein